MSYCVNCGVELDSAAAECPLCNTPVLNPRELEKIMKDRHPFPRERGQVEAVKRKDIGILISIILLSTAVTCGFLNAWAFPGFPWSIPIIGACVVLWVLLIPAVIYVKQSVYTTIFFDGVAVGLYLYMMTFLTKSDNWFMGMALPIVLMLISVTELVTLINRKLPKSFIASSIEGVSYVAVVCVGMEVLIDLYLSGAVRLTWSAVILTICIIIDIALITMLCHKRLRNAVRKRLHF